MRLNYYRMARRLDEMAMVYDKVFEQIDTAGLLTSMSDDMGDLIATVQEELEELEEIVYEVSEHNIGRAPWNQDYTGIEIEEYDR